MFSTETYHPFSNLKSENYDFSSSYETILLQIKTLKPIFCEKCLKIC